MTLNCAEQSLQRIRTRRGPASCQRQRHLREQKRNDRHRFLGIETSLPHCLHGLSFRTLHREVMGLVLLERIGKPPCFLVPTAGLLAQRPPFVYPSMPLIDGSSDETIAANIKELMATGKYAQDQAVAIAYAKAGRARKQEKVMKQIFLPIEKVIERPDGTCEVYGKAAVEQVDKVREVFDYDSSKPLFLKWSAAIQKA